MNDTYPEGREPENRTPGSEAEGSCCASEKDSTSCCAQSAEGASAGKCWKTGAAMIVLVLAVAVAVYSLSTRQNAVETPVAQPADEPVVSEQSAEWTWAEGIDSALRGRDVVFLILPTDDESSTGALMDVVTETAMLVEAADLTVGTVVLSRDGDEFAKAVDRFGIKEFPAVAVLQRGCGNTVVSGEVTENSLLEGFTNICASGNCGPGAASAHVAE